MLSNNVSVSRIIVEAASYKSWVAERRPRSAIGHPTLMSSVGMVVRSRDEALTPSEGGPGASAIAL